MQSDASIINRMIIVKNDESDNIVHMDQYIYNLSFNMKILTIIAYASIGILPIITNSIFSNDRLSVQLFDVYLYQISNNAITQYNGYCLIYLYYIKE